MAGMTQTVDQVAPGPEGVALITRNGEKFLQGVKRRRAARKQGNIRLGIHTTLSRKLNGLKVLNYI